MTCPADLILNRLLDGELTPAEAHAAEAHVRQCPQCAARLAELRMVGDVLRDAPLPAPARAAVERWHRALTQVEEQQVRRLASWMTAAASVVLALSLYSAMSRQAVAQPPRLADWEAALIGIDSSVPAEQATAQWISTDLSRLQRNGGGNP